MSRIRLLGSTNSESTSRMDLDLVMESAQIAVDEFTTAAKQNEDLITVEITDDETPLVTQRDRDLDNLDDVLVETRKGFNAINAMNDTYMLTAPAIRQSTVRDLALVRQVANTAAAGMGLDPDDMLPSTFDDSVGQPMSLNMEGFKDKALMAIRAIFRFILNIYDFAIAIFKTNYSLVGVRLKRLAYVINEFRKDSVNKTLAPDIRVDVTWTVLTARGGYPSSIADIQDVITALDGFNQMFNAMSSFEKEFNVWTKLDAVGGVEDIKQRHVGLVDCIIGKVKLFNQYVGGVEEVGGDIRSRNTVGGSYAVVRNGLGLKNITDFDVAAGKLAVATQLEWVNTPDNAGGTATKLPTCEANDLIKAVANYLELFTGSFKVQVIAGAVANAQNSKRKTEAIAQQMSIELDNATHDDVTVAYITEIAGLTRTLATFNYGAFAQYTRTVADSISAMLGYVEAHRKALQ